MRYRMTKVLGTCLAMLACAPAWAEGVLLQASGAVDMIHDAKRDMVYISLSDGRLLRYHRATGTFLPPIAFSGPLGGMDILPARDQLAIADQTATGADVRVHVVNLRNFSVRRLSAPRATYSPGWAPYEGSAWTVAYAADGSLLVTSRFNGSGWVPLRRFTPLGSSKILGEVRQDTMLKASADRQTIAFAEANISDGRWGLYDVPTGQMVRRQWYQDGTSWFNYEIAVDAIGGQFTIPTYGGTFVYNENYARVATIGQYAGGQPVGVAYHPRQARAYFPWAGSTQIRVYDMRTFQQVGTHDAEYSFTHPGNWAFQPGRIRISEDGSLLMVKVGNGVRLIDTAR
jgi:hypothetical protein